MDSYVKEPKVKILLLKGERGNDGEKGEKGDPGSETAVWGHITGTLEDQQDLAGALDDKLSRTNIKTIEGNSLVGNGDVKLSTTYSNISVSVTPTPSSYESWDTQQRYGYSALISVSGMTGHSMIENIVMTDTLLERIAPVIKTGTGRMRVYTEDNTLLEGTIYTLVTKEV